MIDSLDSQSVSQLEGCLHGFVVAVVDVTAAVIQRGFDGYNLEIVGVGACAVVEVAFRPEKAYTAIAQSGHFDGSRTVDDGTVIQTVLVVIGERHLAPGPVDIHVNEHGSVVVHVVGDGRIIDFNHPLARIVHPLPIGRSDGHR